MSDSEQPPGSPPPPRPSPGRPGRHSTPEPAQSGPEPAAETRPDEAPAVEAQPSGPDPFDGPEWKGAKSFGGTTSGPSTSDVPGRVKVSRRKKRVLRRRRRIGFVMLALGGLVVLVGLYLVITGLFARSQLDTVRTEVGQLRAQIAAGNLPAARHTAADLAGHAHNAELLTSGPVWALAADLPNGGEPFATIRGVTAAVDQLGRDALPQLVTASEQLDPTKLRAADGSINLQPLIDIRPELRKADAVTRSASAKVAGLPQHTWISSIDDARTQVMDQLTSLGRTISSADLAAQIAPSMLGHSGPRSYMLSFQTEAELRGTGGLPGAFAIVKADDGKLSFTRFESDSALRKVTSGLDFGQDFNQLYAGANATDEYSDSNVSPNFPYAAQIWTAMWKKYSGQSLDGALALDPTALSYLLKVTGPAPLPNGGGRVTAANVVALTQQRVYSKFADNQDARKRYQLQLAKTIATHVLGAGGSSTALVRAAGRAASEHRLLAWSSDPSLQRLLAQTSLSGVVPRTSAPYAGLSINNAAGNKMDYYLHASMTWKRVSCAASGDVEVTLTLRNGAPAKLPRYVYGLTGRRGYPTKPGDNRLLVGYFATKGAQLTSVTLNGKKSTSQIGVELGHPVFTADLLLPRGQTQTVVLHLREPASTDAPIVRAQPLVNPLRVSVNDSKCG